MHWFAAQRYILFWSTYPLRTNHCQMNKCSVVLPTPFTQVRPVVAECCWQCVCCCGCWCWYVSLRGNSSCSYLCFILTDSPGSALQNKRLQGPLWGTLETRSVYCKHTGQGHRRGHVWVCVCVWRRLLSQCFYRVRLQQVMGKSKEREKTLGRSKKGRV